MYTKKSCSKRYQDSNYILFILFRTFNRKRNFFRTFGRLCFHTSYLSSNICNTIRSITTSYRLVHIIFINAEQSETQLSGELIYFFPKDRQKDKHVQEQPIVKLLRDFVCVACACMAWICKCTLCT